MTTRTALNDRVFTLARLVVITLVVALLALFMYGATLFPTYVGKRPAVFLDPSWTAEKVQYALAELGLSLRAFVWLQFIFGVLTALPLALVAALILLRRRIQHTTDRRFYRRKYDAQKTLESFATRLRNETDLETLTRDMVQVVEEMLQPTQVSLWLREPARNRREQQL